MYPVITFPDFIWSNAIFALSKSFWLRNFDFLAEAVIFIAVAAKSNATYKAFNASKKFVKEHLSDPVPVHLRNASTVFEKKLEYGKEYDYSHDNLDGISRNQSYFPHSLSSLNPVFYEPVDRGLEVKIALKLSEIKLKRNGN